MDEKQAKICYLKGYLDALYIFAINRDEQLVVGCGVTTYKEAKAGIITQVENMTHKQLGIVGGT